MYFLQKYKQIRKEIIMPNIVGGDQFHPAYKPRQLEKNEVLVDSVLYTITIKRNKVTITYEKVDGQSGYESEANAPRRVKNRIKKLKGGK